MNHIYQIVGRTLVNTLYTLLANAFANTMQTIKTLMKASHKSKNTIENRDANHGEL